MTLTPAQNEILRQALALRSGVPTRDDETFGHAEECEPMAAAGLMSYRQGTSGRFYRVTGAGVRATCPDARAAVYLTGEDVTVFTSDTGRHRMRWDGPDKGRFAQGGVYRVSAHAVKFKEAT